MVDGGQPTQRIDHKQSLSQLQASLRVCTLDSLARADRMTDHVSNTNATVCKRASVCLNIRSWARLGYTTTHTTRSYQIARIPYLERWGIFIRVLCLCSMSV